MDLARGTVTDLAAAYPPVEAEKAAERVQDSIAAANVEIERLRGFVSDNANLIGLVQRLPESLRHNIMVPFGKVAFFPGHLVHTNEFLVLLGEGYYAETTAKHTLEILRRRGKSLDSQLSSLNAVVQDLRAEASFFRKTASEIAEEGIVEIREDYAEESSVESESETGLVEQVFSSASEADGKKVALDDEEFARIMARFDELEKEELEAEADEESEDENEQTEADNTGSRQEPEYRVEDKEALAEKVTNRQHYHHDHQDFTRELNEQACTGLTTEAIPADGPLSHGNTLAGKMKKSVKFMLPSVEENKVQATASQSQMPVQTSEPSFDSRKAFTGSIVERADNLETSSRKHTPSQTSGSQTSKPVSRFKMLRK